MLATEFKTQFQLIKYYSSCNYLYTIEIPRYHPMAINRPKEAESKMSNTPSFIIYPVILNYVHTEQTYSKIHVLSEKLKQTNLKVLFNHEMLHLLLKGNKHFLKE